MLRYGRSTVFQRCQTSLPSSVSPAARAVAPIVDTGGPANTLKSGIWKKGVTADSIVMITAQIHWNCFTDWRR